MNAADYLQLFNDGGALYAPLYGALLAWSVGVAAVRLIMGWVARIGEDRV